MPGWREPDIASGSQLLLRSVEERNLHTPYAVYECGPTSMAVSTMAVETSSRRPKR